MRKPRKLPTVASMKRNAKRLEKRMAVLDKQFDLGFITEDEFDTKRIRSMKHSIEFGLAESELIIKEFNGIIKYQKLTLTRSKQHYLLLLAASDTTKMELENWDVVINLIEQRVELLSKSREKAWAQKKRQEDMLEQIKNLEN